MKRSAELTWIEDNAPYSRRFEDRYFSAHDGRAETQAVFLAGNGLPERWADVAHFHIAELGFGTGLNFFETLAQWRKHAPETAQLTYSSFELYPLTTDEISRALARWPKLQELAGPLIAQNSLQFGNVELRLVIGDARANLPPWGNKADAWYLDGFSPAKNPQLWEEDLLQAVFAHTTAGGTFSTYTAAGIVRRNLQAAGFEVQRVKGFGAKRERLQGTKPASVSSSLVIRPAESGDIIEIKTVLQETWHDTYDGVFGPKKVDRLCEHWHSLERLRRRLHKKNSFMLVAVMAEQIVATASSSRHEDGKVIMKQLYVRPEQQGLGIGTALFKRLMKLIPDYRCIELEVEPRNEGAIAFYKKHGFKVTATLDDCGNTGDLVEALVMTRTI